MPQAHQVVRGRVADAPEHAQAVQRRHLDHKSKQVIDDCVEEFVRHLTPGHVGDALQLVVQVQLQEGGIRARRIVGSWVMQARHLCTG